MGWELGLTANRHKEHFHRLENWIVVMVVQVLHLLKIIAKLQRVNFIVYVMGIRYTSIKLLK